MYTVAIAGTTEHTVTCARALASHPQFEISWLLTPTPKPIGRKQVVTRNPLHQYGVELQIPILLIEKRIEDQLKDSISALTTPDFLLVVDFGHLIPSWLLSLPTIASLNIHPSALPRWRGSSPGQFVLLAGETASAVTLIEMSHKLDQGPIITQLPFSIAPDWTQTEYYNYSFSVMDHELVAAMLGMTEEHFSTTAQPEFSPTPTARRLRKEDSFVEWDLIKQSMLHPGDTASDSIEELTVSPQSLTAAARCNIPTTIDHEPVMQAVLAAYPPQKHPVLLERASRAFTPWPRLWTQIPTNKGKRRMQITACTVTTTGSLQLDRVIIAGLPEKPWTEVKNIMA